MDIKLICQFAFYGGLVIAVGSFVIPPVMSFFGGIPLNLDQYAEITDQYAEITSAINRLACIVFGFSSAFLGAFGLYVTRNTKGSGP